MYHDFNPPIRARYIRFLPQEWVGHISMRVELYGCQGTGGFRLFFFYLKQVGTVGMTMQD